MSSRVGKNLVYLLLSQLATWSVTLVVLVVAPRQLGDAGFGQITFATSFVAIFATIAGLGTSPLLIKTVARDRATFGPFVVNAVVLKLFVVALLSIVALGVAVLIGTSGTTLLLVVIGLVGMLFIILNDIFSGALGGLERMGKPALWGVAKVWVASLGGVAVLWLGGGVVGYATIVAAAGVIPLVANGRVVWPKVGDARLEGAVWRTLIVGGIPLMMLSGLIKVYGTIDVPILRGITDDETVGWYGLAYRLVTVPIFIATTTVQAFFPSFSAHGATRSPEFRRQVNRAIWLVTLVSVPAAAGISAVANDLISFIYGPEFENAIPIMQILALHLPFAAVGFVLGSSLVASDRQKPYVVLAAISAGISPVLYVVLINWASSTYDNGGIGAAIATLCVEVFMLTGAIIIRAEGVMDRATAWVCLRCVVAGGIMAGAVWVTDALPLLVQVLVGIVVYAAAALALRAVTIGEIRRGVDTFRGALSRRKPAPKVPVSE